MKYSSITGKTVEIIETGKSFKSITIYPATKHSPKERVEKHHRTWGGVERVISGMEKS